MVTNSERQDLEHAYNNLISIWTLGIRDYHSLLSDYLTANSIFVAAIGFLVARQPATIIFSVLILVLCCFGVLITFKWRLSWEGSPPRMPSGNGNCAALKEHRSGRIRNCSSISKDSEITINRWKMNETIQPAWYRTGRPASTVNGGRAVR